MVSQADADVGGGLRQYARQAQGRRTYGLYLAGHKVGWLINAFDLETREGKDVAAETWEMMMTGIRGGELYARHAAGATYFALTGDGPVVGGSETVDENGIESSHVARLQGSQLVLTSQIGGKTSERPIQPPQQTLARRQALDAFLRRATASDETFEAYSVEWSAEDIDKREVYTFHGRGPSRLHGVPGDVARVTIASGGVDRQVEIDDAGWWVSLTAPPSREIKREDEAVAKQIVAGDFDFFTAMAIPIDKALGPPERVGHLVLEVHGPSGFPADNSARQHPRVEGRTLLIEVFRDVPNAPATPLTNAEKNEALAATAMLPIGDPTIQRFAREAAAGATDPAGAVVRLLRRIKGTLTDSNIKPAINAAQVLAQKAGACTEFAMLFVAASRSLGIPAKLVMGLAYMDLPNRPLFGWHVWAEYHDGHRWVGVDPLWGEDRVDATHIKTADVREGAVGAVPAGTTFRLRSVAVDPPAKP